MRNSKNSKPVFSINLISQEKVEYPSIMEAARQLSTIKQNILGSLRFGYKVNKMYKFFYKGSA